LWDEARRSFERTALHDRAAICGSVCQDIIRRSAREEGGLLVEADAMFRRLAQPRMPGLETFDDRMHWKRRFNCLMWTEIADTLRRDPGLAALPWDAARLKTMRDGCETRWRAQAGGGQVINTRRPGPGGQPVPRSGGET
ncbi:MAG: hypothetical protein AABZ35_01345, partial [Gemmatimonadota bacterium]